MAIEVARSKREPGASEPQVFLGECLMCPGQFTKGYITIVKSELHTLVGMMERVQGPARVAREWKGERADGRCRHFQRAYAL